MYYVCIQLVMLLHNILQQKAYDYISIAALSLVYTRYIYEIDVFIL